MFKHFLYKTLIAFAFSAIAGMGSIQALDFCCSNNTDDCSRWCDDCNYGSLRPAQPFGCGFFLGAEWLYWTSDVSDLDYAFDNANGFDVARDGDNAKMHFLDYDWTSGFRIYGGYRWGCDGWDVRAIYTHWCNDGSDSVSLGTPSSASDHIKPTLWHPAFGNDRANDAEAKGEIEYKVFDVLLSHPFCINKTLISRPFFGFRGVWLDQELDVTYSGGRDFLNADGVVEWESKYCAYGLHVGIDWYVNFCECYGLYATFAGSIVTGETDDHLFQEGPEGTSGSSTTIENVNIKEEQWVTLPGLHLALGASWESCVCDCYYTIVNLGYEFTHWNNVPQIRRFVDGIQDGVNAPSARGCLSFHGLVVRAEVHF